jgi:hypothetical protein
MDRYLFQRRLPLGGRQWAGLHPVINAGSLEAGEFIKLAGIVYRDVNIVLELATFAEFVGLDIWPLLEAAETDSETGLLRRESGRRPLRSKAGGHADKAAARLL